MAPLLLYQASIAQLGEVEGQGTIWNAQSASDSARRHSIIACLNQLPKHRQPMLLS
jgi:hypothetical protein